MSDLGIMNMTSSLLSSCIWKSKNDVLNEKITKIEYFRFDINIPRYFSLGTWYNRQHLLVKISSGEHYSFSEIPALRNIPDEELITWVNYVKRYKELWFGTGRVMFERSG